MAATHAQAMARPSIHGSLPAEMPRARRGYKSHSKRRRCWSLHCSSSRAMGVVPPPTKLLLTCVMLTSPAEQGPATALMATQAITKALRTICAIPRAVSVNGLARSLTHGRGAGLTASLRGWSKDAPGVEPWIRRCKGPDLAHPGLQEALFGAPRWVEVIFPCEMERERREREGVLVHPGLQKRQHKLYLSIPPC